MELNHRYFSMGFSLERESRDERLTRKIVGHAAVFDKTTDIGHFKEIVAPGAFKNSIRSDDIRALFNNNPDRVLGRTKSGTLHLREDEIGLRMEVEPPDTHWAKDLLISIQRGDISGASFGFIPMKQDWIGGKGEPLTRILREVKLFDVSPVTYPQYQETDVGLRKQAEEVYREYRSLKSQYVSHSRNWRLD